MSLAMHN
ncbi:uncharacterized protein ARMOST_21496 [Armillaria ostoyae]|nr:uncharacterized protein ARMOST_21496 [Armillaria ostoyae]